MRLSLTATLACVAGLAIAQPATAGPIDWSYRATDRTGAVLSERSHLTELVWSDFFLPNPWIDGTYIPDPNPGNGIHTDIWRCEATVRITDHPSGGTWDVVINRDEVTQYEVMPDGSWYPLYEGPGGGPWPGVEMTLGENTYSVSAPGGELLVRITHTPTANTPEPGTLALAGLGLAGVGLVRRRK